MNTLKAYPAYKDTGVRWLSKVPIHWTVEPLGKLFDERRETGSDTEYAALSVTRDGVVPQLDHVAKSDHHDSRKLVRAGDFAINSRSDRKGSAGTSPMDGSVSVITTVLRPRSLDPKFVHHALRSQPFQEEFYRYGSGIVADLWSTRWSAMKGIRLAVPPSDEQHQIAQFLDRETAEIDAFIADQEELIRLLSERRAATISHAVTKGLDPSAPVKDSGVEWLGEMAAEWSVTRTRFLCSVSTGSGDTVDATDSGEYPFYVRSDVPLRSDGYDFEGEAVLTAGDGAGVGKVFHLVNGKFHAHQRVYVMNGFRRVTARYFFYYFSAMFSKVALDGSAKSTVDSVRRTMITDLPVSHPDERMQRMICDYLDRETAQLDAAIADAREAIALSRERRAALISAAVTGKIDVRGAA